MTNTLSILAALALGAAPAQAQNPVRTGTSPVTAEAAPPAKPDWKSKQKDWTAAAPAKPAEPLSTPSKPRSALAV